MRLHEVSTIDAEIRLSIRLLPAIARAKLHGFGVQSLWLNRYGGIEALTTDYSQCRC